MISPSIRKKFNSLQTQQDVCILGIETSCDETAAAVVKNGRVMLSNVISSQIALHRKFGGVVPEVASRNHTLAINTVVDEALAAARIKPQDVHAIAVTYGAGLAGALLVGVSYAKAAAYALNIPLIKVNHIEAHVAANYIAFEDLKPPFIALAASGGHTQIIQVNGYNDYRVLGGTADDAIGEAFDKAARLLGLPYPGGPEVDRLAREGKPVINFFKNTKPAVQKDLRLSYSGLKTALVNYLNTAKMKGEPFSAADVCASFTAAAVDNLAETVLYAARQHNLTDIALAGGVASNTYLRQKMLTRAQEEGLRVFIPPPVLCTDNAAMVAARAYYSIIDNTHLAALDLNAQSRLNNGF
ncbi:MAG: tRNA (adenosine(37)-N6)-threonylcarbamoyltransferase complex transferase subunit TsaD [Firmicutes bacterium]|nr:tRNA (adenosine(37)-N6)-threonylcarbamoyltransferase complex transferase subunit TsaD [Bacillota bacterium]